VLVRLAPAAVDSVTSLLVAAGVGAGLWLFGWGSTWLLAASVAFGILRAMAG